MERYGGGGIKGAGTCVLDLECSDGKIRWIVGGLQAK
jgi:hypothetical protein